MTSVLLQSEPGPEVTQPAGHRRRTLLASSVLMIVVAAAAGAVGPIGRGAPGRLELPGPVEYTGFAIAGGLGAFGLVFSLATGFRARQRRRLQERASAWQKLLMVVIVLAWAAAAIAACLVLKRVMGHLGGIFNGLVKHVRLDLSSASPAKIHALTTGLVIGFGLVAVVAVAAKVRSTAGRRAARPLPGLVAAADQAVLGGIAALSAEPDSRRAVIGAYAHMELCLAGAGMPRKPSEAPFEHLHRVGEGLGPMVVQGRTLAGLFEWAKFAHHPCGQEMKASALTALARIEEHLQVRT